MDFITLFLSLRCTHACAHCIFGCSPNHDEHMPWEVFQQSMALSQKSGINKLNFFGGEPLLNPSFFKMTESALENGFSLIVTTNCRPLEDIVTMAKFVELTEKYKERLIIITARDKFHLKFYDPLAVVNLLRGQGYSVTVDDYSDRTIALTEFNIWNRGLEGLDPGYSCCKGEWTDFLGILPDGSWTLCPPSIKPFGSVFTQSLDEMIEFKKGLVFNSSGGCTVCLKDFKRFKEEFERLQNPV
ncbi:MAG: radical SAM protein [Dehalogenimonas sp.]